MNTHRPPLAEGNNGLNDRKAWRVAESNETRVDRPLRKIDNKAKTKVGSKPKLSSSIHEMLLTICKTKEFFTTNDIKEFSEFQNLVGETDPRALGPLMQWAQREGWCEPTRKFRKSTRQTSHRRPIRVWRSRLFRPLWVNPKVGEIVQANWQFRNIKDKWVTIPKAWLDCPVTHTDVRRLRRQQETEK